MQRLILWMLILGSLAPTSRADEPVKPPAKERFHLYLLIGQSNMAGRGVIEEQDKLPPPRVLKFTKEKTWAAGVDPLHFDKPVAGVGIGTTFGRVMAEAQPEVVIGLVPCAVGGTPLARWQKGGDLYKQGVERTQAAMRDGTLKGILWHQGESDSGSETTAKNYAERLAQMIRDLRTELNAGDIPFVAGELGQFLQRESKDGKPSYWPLVNEQINSLPKLVPHTAVASSKDLKHKGDVVHFDSPSLREFGKRYATVMQAQAAAVSQESAVNTGFDLRPIKIAMIGDSTMASYPKPPEDRPSLTGWGQVFELSFNDQVKVSNHAQSGRSSKSFLREGRWEPVLREKPDFVFIQFGHNDQPGKGDRTTDPNGDFQENLHKYIEDARAAGSQPVLVTPVARRIFDNGKAVTTLTPYADAMKKVAGEKKVPLVDLHAASFDLFNKLGDAASAEFSASAGDRTHFSRKGAIEIAKLVANRLPQDVPALRVYLRSTSQDSKD